MIGDFNHMVNIMAQFFWNVSQQLTRTTWYQKHGLVNTPQFRLEFHLGFWKNKGTFVATSSTFH
jgi:hypothetical protein